MKKISITLSLKKTLYKWLLPKFISKACKSTIPRSGEEGKNVNCYSVKLDNEDSTPYFVATGYAYSKLLGLRWNGESYKDEYCLELADLDNGKLRITHYCGFSEVRYDTIYDAAFHYVTKFIYFKIQIYRYISLIDQYFFNKKMLVTKERMELLQFMLNDQLSRNHDGIDTIDLMTKLYSIKWVLHPSGNEVQKKLDIYLDSLVYTGELKLINYQYVVTGKAIVTIEQYEKEEQKHSEMIKLQRILAVITFGLIIVGLVQASVIKLPTWVDFSNQKIEQP